EDSGEARRAAPDGDLSAVHDHGAAILRDRRARPPGVRGTRHERVVGGRARVPGTLSDAAGSMRTATSWATDWAATRAHSITLSARTARDCGIVSPNARAVLRLMTSSNLVGCSKGSSPGLAPFRILSTWPAELRMIVLRSGP